MPRTMKRAVRQPVRASRAVQVFLKKSLAVGGLPFELKMTPPPIPNMAMMARSGFDAELQKGYDQAMAGDLVDARRAHAELMDGIASWNASRNRHPNPRPT